MEGQAFEDHAVWSAIDSAEEILGETEAKASESEDSARSRIKFVADYTKSFRAIAPEYFTTPMLDGVHSAWTNAVQNLTQYRNGAGEQYLQGAMNQVESIVPTLGSWPKPTARGGAAAQAKAMFDEVVSTAESTISTLRAEVERLRSEAADTRQKHDEQLQDAADQAEALKATIAEQNTRIETAEERLDRAVADATERFTNAQTQRQEKFDGWLEEQEDELVNQKAQPILDQVSEVKGKADNVLEDLTALRQQVEKVASDATGAVLARDYGKYSLREWISGVVAYVAGFAALVWVAWHLIGTVNDLQSDTDVSWQYVSLKLGLAVTAGVAAAVAFQFGSRAIARANTNKRVELELRAIGPLLADVDESKAVDDAKLKFVERMFGRAWENSQPDGDEDRVSLSLVERIAGALFRGGQGT